MSCNYYLVFVHIGNEFPIYFADSLYQARIFNKCEFFIIGSYRAISLLPNTLLNKINAVPFESLGISNEHAQYLDSANIDRSFRNGFWLHTTERFFYIERLIRKYHLKNVFHIENDMLLYADLNELLPVFKKYYPGIAATFDDDDRCIPGFIFFSNLQSAKRLTEFVGYIFDRTGSKYNDMQILALFKKAFGPVAIDTLPIVPHNQKVPLKSLLGRKPKNEAEYSNHISDFKSIFDAAAIGQYLGGIDPQNAGGRDTIGFINETCVFNPSYFRYEWLKDENGRRIPYMINGEARCRINNLHIHCKRLADFLSKNRCSGGLEAK